MLFLCQRPAEGTHVNLNSIWLRLSLFFSPDGASLEGFLKIMEQMKQLAEAA